MILTDSEYFQSMDRVAAFLARLDSRMRDLRELGLTAEQAAKVTEPERVFYDQISEEIAAYDSSRSG